MGTEQADRGRFKRGYEVLAEVLGIIKEFNFSFLCKHANRCAKLYLADPVHTCNIHIYIYLYIYIFFYFQLCDCIYDYI